MILSVRIDGEWTAREFAAFLDGLEALAGFIDNGEVISMYRQSPSIVPVVGGLEFSTTENFTSHLKVIRLQFNSPGIIDLAGLGKIVEEIRLFLEFLIKLYVHRNDRDLDREERKIELAAKRAELLQQITDLHPRYVKFVKQKGADALIEAVLAGRVTSVETKQIEDTK